MGINIRQKGAGAEREVVQLLEPIIRAEMELQGYPLPSTPIVQRNQNQSAVGGGDLTGTFGLSIEVKRQEDLSINTWWQQCTASAQRNGDKPVLMFRQSGKKWRIVTDVWSPLPGHGLHGVRAELDCDTFLSWFRVWVKKHLEEHGAPRV